MGRIKTQQIMRAGNKLMAMHPDEFTTDFNENKKLVVKHAEISSKKLRNIVAGYLARLVKRRKQEEV